MILSEGDNQLLGKQNWNTLSPTQMNEFCSESEFISPMMLA